LFVAPVAAVGIDAVAGDDLAGVDAGDGDGGLIDEGQDADTGVVDADRGVVEGSGVSGRDAVGLGAGVVADAEGAGAWRGRGQGLGAARGRSGRLGGQEAFQRLVESFDLPLGLRMGRGAVLLFDPQDRQECLEGVAAADEPGGEREPVIVVTTSSPVTGRSGRMYWRAGGFVRAGSRAAAGTVRLCGAAGLSTRSFCTASAASPTGDGRFS